MRPVCRYAFWMISSFVKGFWLRFGPAAFAIDGLAGAGSAKPRCRFTDYGMRRVAKTAEPLRAFEIPAAAKPCAGRRSPASRASLALGRTRQLVPLGLNK
jgi:hypothetical protein